MTTKISEAKFEALKSKLRELFELDKSDLDFGIYRIMAAKNKEITAFLDRHLKATVREVLESRGSDESTKLASEISKAREAAATAGFNPDDSPRVKELEEQYAKLGGGSTEELEADIYNHLLNFFSRYYDEGDFISKRFYKGDTYSIPYGGEEVALHWANKDQYYIKSSEWHKDYRFRVDGKTVQFRLVEATAEAGNNKEPDESKRRYILASATPVLIDEAHQTLTLNFEFRCPAEADEKRIEENEATRIFGGNFDKNSGRAKGDQREGFCADAESRALAQMPVDWSDLLKRISATPAKPKRTVLGKHLDHFTARNTFDYFIHKNLGEFLRRELDGYLKNEVVRIDDLASLEQDRLTRVRSWVVAIRQSANRIIDFLANIENFQRKLWRKKKFVLQSDYCFTLGSLPVKFLDLLLDNTPQLQEWRELFGVEVPVSISIEQLNELQKTHPTLVVDTKYLPVQERFQILQTLQEGGVRYSGLLINSDNFQALSLLQKQLRNQVRCFYIDPPYNTGNDDFVYKDAYQHSSWLSLLRDRVELGLNLLSDAGAAAFHINDIEHWRLRGLCDQLIGDSNYITTVTTQCATASSFKTVNLGPTEVTDHILLYAVDKSAYDYTAQHIERREVDIVHFSRFVVNKSAPPQEWTFAPIKPHVLREMGFEADTTQQQMKLARARYGDDAEVVVAKKCQEFAKLNAGSVFDSKLFQKPSPWLRRHIDESRQVEHVVEVHRDNLPSILLYKGRQIYFLENNFKEVDGKRMLAQSLPNLWTDLDTNNLVYEGDVDFPAGKKPLTLVKRILAMSNGVNADFVLDFFAGSGTLGHAVLDMNSVDGGCRKFCLVEMGRYFASATLPRIKKALYSSEWKKGKASSIRTDQQFFNYLALESYDDALNNLPSPDGRLLEVMDKATRDTLITYSLDLELGPHMLNMDAFKDPWGYKIYAQLAGEEEVSLHRVDMVETFNYLIGLKVQAYGPIERYSAEFVRLPHGDDKDAKGNPLPDDKREGRLRVEGRLRRDAEGPFVYQRLEGEMNDGNATRVLVIWRKLTDDAEKDAAVLEAWMARHRESTKERSDYREYHLIYLNGPITLPQPTQELRTVLPTEQTFKDRMFEDTEV